MGWDDWFKGKGGVSKSSSGNSRTATVTDVTKLKGYRDLASDALERAYTADVGGDFQRALQLYEFALKPLDEGLVLPRNPGALSVSNESQWVAEMSAWKRAVLARIGDLRAPPGAARSSAGPVRATKVARSAAVPGPPHQPGVSPDQQVAAVPRQRAVPSSRQQPGASPSRQGGAVGGAHREAVLSELLESGGRGVAWEDVLGLGTAKQALQEAVILPARRPDLFQGLRAPVKGMLLYGPPGNGKTMLARALATESGASFFNISPSSLTSRWMGEGEKLMRALFQVAAERQPSIIFMDEVDALLSARTEGEHDAARRLKTQFLVEFEGAAQGSDHVIVIGATNRPHELDPAVLRRLSKRIYIPMPDAEGRAAILKHLLKGQHTTMRGRDVDAVAAAAKGYSASDLAALAKEAAIRPIREVPPEKMSTISPGAVRRTGPEDFFAALQTIRPSLDEADVAGYEAWTHAHGTGA